MNDNNKHRFSPPSFGGVSLLIIFAVLCLTVFALLSLSTVSADKRISDAMAESVCRYYEADCEAQTILARLRGGDIPSGVVFDGNICHYTCRISDDSNLEVEVYLDGSDFDVIRWQAVTVSDWNADENMNLWNGE